MSVQTFIILTPEQKNAAEALNDGDAAVMPRQIDNPSAPSELFGLYVAPARILTNPDYARWHDSLSALPRQDLDADVIFAPPPEEI